MQMTQFHDVLLSFDQHSYLTFKNNVCNDTDQPLKTAFYAFCCSCFERLKWLCGHHTTQVFEIQSCDNCSKLSGDFLLVWMNRVHLVTKCVNVNQSQCCELISYLQTHVCTVHTVHTVDRL